MYRCKLDIRIFSEDPLLLADVRNIAPLERFEHEVSGYRSFSPEAVRGSDIIVLDLPVAERPEAVRALCKPGAILVFWHGSGGVRRSPHPFPGGRRRHLGEAFP